MKRFIVSLVVMLFVLAANAQLKQEVISSAGGSNAGGGISISWTLGETIIPTFKSGDLILTHGFQQQVIITTVEENIDVLVNVKIFPNPASENITIQFQSPVEGEIGLTINDSNGRLIKKDIVETNMSEKQINLQDVAAGIYYLRLTKGKAVNVYKVVKL